MEEHQANMFASNFLMPAPDVRSSGLTSPDMKQLASAKRRWNVSVAALNYRLHDLGITSDWHYRMMCIEISKVGREKEPNPMDAQQSQVLAKVLASLRTGGLGRSEIARDLRIHRQDLDGLLFGATLATVETNPDTVAASHERPILSVVK